MKDGWIEALFHLGSENFTYEIFYALNPKMMQCYIYLKFNTNDEILMHYNAEVCSVRRSGNYKYHFFYKEDAKFAECLLCNYTSSKWYITWNE